MKNKTFKITPRQRLTSIGILIGLLLMTPLIAMQFTEEVSWNSFDFIVAGILLSGAGLFCELVLRTIRSTRNRVLLCGIIVLILFLVWAELAVGLFDTRYAGS